MGNEFVSGSAATIDQGEPENGLPFFTYTDIFERQAPYYMAMGMSYDEFWNGDCLLTNYYRKAYEYKRKARNEELWLQGMYIYEALCDVAPVLNANAKKGTKVTPYSEEPYPLTKADLEAYNKRKEEKEALKMRESFEKMVASFNSNFKRKENKDG